MCTYFHSWKPYWVCKYVHAHTKEYVPMDTQACPLQIIMPNKLFKFEAGMRSLLDVFFHWHLLSLILNPVWLCCWPIFHLTCLWTTHPCLCLYLLPNWHTNLSPDSWPRFCHHSIPYCLHVPLLLSDLDPAHDLVPSCLAVTVVTRFCSLLVWVNSGCPYRSAFAYLTPASKEVLWPLIGKAVQLVYAHLLSHQWRGEIWCSWSDVPGQSVLLLLIVIMNFSFPQ